METATENIQRVHHSQAYGSKGKKCIIEIYVDAGREFTKEEKWAFRDAADLIQKAVSNASYALDKEEQQLGEEHTQKLINLFGERKIFIEKIENGYWKEDVHNPWLIVTTDKGHIKIGWRKRVIQIEWDKTIVDKKADDLFPDEDVTKEGKMIHAWTYEKAQEYLNKILS
jgi:hypothetical protein